MATTKRMFSNDIVGTDAFLEMPSTSQALYFHLGMRCDDDGFVNPNTTMRMTGANKNDLDILIGKRFLLAFKNGVVVIKHHRINNNWDSRDCRRTLYTEQLSELFIKENNSYTFDEEQGKPVSDKYVTSKANIGKKVLSDGNTTETRRQNRIEENRIEENRIDTCVSFEEWYKSYPSKKARGDGERAWKKLNEEQKHKPKPQTPNPKPQTPNPLNNN